MLANQKEKRGPNIRKIFLLRPSLTGWFTYSSQFNAHTLDEANRRQQVDKENVL